ncbi:L,D-transpeptidase [Nocardioides acrostichi]|uniref:L,D-transpeptidase family protein n=1 Tax=Nocardioides acrostichi TaxID=2784339 RepID=A0A930UTH4_9ACTN|nr:Ig-like domain-containing protein [Nocardioides acrostichi]MBF4160543.1 L,D-transpeptidase family protein [Nocardioides acrostichi]
MSRRSCPALAHRYRPVLLIGAAALALAALSGCETSSQSGAQERAAATSGDDSATEPAVQVPEPAFTSNVDGAKNVAVDTRVAVTVENATLKSVTVKSPEGAVAGDLAGNKYSWRASDLLEPGTTYQVIAKGTDEAGDPVRNASRFTTQALTLDQQTYPSIAPLDGETVGVGMPVIVHFDVPVTDRAAIEKHLTVTSTPKQAGSWHWISDNEVHWRPQSYWKPGTSVHVAADINSIPAGNGIYGQMDRDADFTVGDAHIYKVNAQTHQMQVFRNGKLLRTIPITTGKPGFDTRNGTKVIIEKFASKRMNSETVGIGGSEAYDLDNVQWAMRLTYSGEFIHAAPWSVGSQGYANVSHGCTGMSTENAAWLYAMSRRGDVVVTTGTNGSQMDLTNGYGDWNESYAQYRQGSAL